MATYKEIKGVTVQTLDRIRFKMLDLGLYGGRFKQQIRVFLDWWKLYGYGAVGGFGSGSTPKCKYRDMEWNSIGLKLMTCLQEKVITHLLEHKTAAWWSNRFSTLILASSTASFDWDGTNWRWGYDDIQEDTDLWEQEHYLQEWLQVVLFLQVQIIQM